MDASIGTLLGVMVGAFATSAIAIFQAWVSGRRERSKMLIAWTIQEHHRLLDHLEKYAEAHRAEGKVMHLRPLWMDLYFNTEILQLLEKRKISAASVQALNDQLNELSKKIDMEPQAMDG